MSGNPIWQPNRTEQDEDVARLRQELHRAAMVSDDPPRDAVRSSDPCAAARLKCADGLIAARRMIGSHFKEALFSDPARDLLLDLYVARARGREVALSSACIVAGVPAATALRAIGLLRTEGMIVVEADRRDHRLILVRLSDEAVIKMDCYLDDVSALFGSAS